MTVLSISPPSMNALLSVSLSLSLSLSNHLTPLLFVATGFRGKLAITTRGCGGGDGGVFVRVRGASNLATSHSVNYQ